MGAFDEDWNQALRNMGEYLADFFPPDLTPTLLRTLFDAHIETIQMAYLGTLIGAFLAIPFAALATRTITGAPIAHTTRTVLAAIRTIPSLVWALFFIAVAGLGPLPGVLGLTAYTIGYLGKLYYEAFEGVDPDVLEAVRSSGASRWQLVRHGILPEAGNALASQLLFIFEYNVRASSILGFVGAGGIGFYIAQYIAFQYYAQLATLLLMLFGFVLAIDWISAQIRRRFLIDVRETAGGPL